MIQFKRTLDSSFEFLQICRLPDEQTLTSEALGRESAFVVQITTGSGGHGDFVGLYDLDGRQLQTHQHTDWEMAEEAPDDVIMAVANWADVRRAVIERVDPYAGLDIEQAVAMASGRSELPLIGTQIGYADIRNARTFHDFGGRLYRAGLELRDHGSGYTVCKRGERTDVCFIPREMP